MSTTGAVELKSGEELAAVGRAGGAVREVLDAVRGAGKVGVTAGELAAPARAVMTEHAATSALVRGVSPRAKAFPATVAVSINEVIARGVPASRRIRRGDVVTVECAVRLRGWCASGATTWVAGGGAPEERDVVEHGWRALDDGIAAAVPGNSVGDVSQAVGVVVRGGGFGLVPTIGYGIGRDAVEPPVIEARARRGTGAPLRPGMLLVIGPRLTAGGGDECERGADGVSLMTGDGSVGVYVAHTVAVTEDGPRVLTGR